MSDKQQPQAASFASQSQEKQHRLDNSTGVSYLSDDEIARFIDELDPNLDGYIIYGDIERKLDQVYSDLAGPDDDDHSPERHAFLRGMVGFSAANGDRFTREEFKDIVRRWNIPSLEKLKTEEEAEHTYFQARRLGWRRMRAYMSVNGPKIAFITVFVAAELAFGIWQLVKYETVPEYRAAFGWGVVMAKTNAGTLYPTFFFLILSMSRYFSTFVKRWYFASRYTSVLFSHEFHISVSCLGLAQATLHALGHLAAGTFRHGSNPSFQTAVAGVLGQDAVPRTYIDYVRSLPGWTGLTAIGMFYILSLLSIPQVRRWNYELFQFGHLLMFPIIGLMMAHGTASLLQWPMFGYFLAFPALLVIVERTVRVSLGFHRIEATIQLLDNDTVEVAATIPPERVWSYRAGQYILLQVPALSKLEWHPFTVSFCRGSEMSVHIKACGSWTRRLCELASETNQIQIGINGPFGAPAQHFHDFQQSIIIGAGIGVTPFAGILADLQHKDDIDHGGPNNHVVNSGGADNPEVSKWVTQAHQDLGQRAMNGGVAPIESSSRSGTTVDTNLNQSMAKSQSDCGDCPRIDFHWMVRNRNHLLWFADLLNEVSNSQQRHRAQGHQPHLDIRINTHITAKHKSISPHVYRWLLELHRTDRQPKSLFTGLVNPTHFGRPDFESIFQAHYEDMCKLQLRKRLAADAIGNSNCNGGNVLNVGVFYCGASATGKILADKCAELTTQARYDGSMVKYCFLTEVF